MISCSVEIVGNSRTRNFQDRFGADDEEYASVILLCHQKVYVDRRFEHSRTLCVGLAVIISPHLRMESTFGTEGKKLELKRGNG